MAMADVILTDIDKEAEGSQIDELEDIDSGRDPRRLKR